MNSEPKISKTIFFIRHGQYKKNPEKLTALGRKQARLVAEAVRHLKPSKLYSSTMPRAKETAKFIARKTRLKSKAKAFFCEGILPGTAEFHKHLSKKMSKTEKIQLHRKMQKAKYSSYKAFKYIFKLPKKGESCEIVVAHGNVIRHWVCKALKISEVKWLNMDVIHASVTAIRINSKGKFVLLRFSDCGHIPQQMRTYV